MRARKGSQFEREICRRLSLWWTDGKRDDIFWRSSQSGGRATQRSKKGLRTSNSYGDVAALDPSGRPFLHVFTVELKRGNSHGHPLDLLDSKETNVQRPWDRTLEQVVDSRHAAGSLGWLLIHRRDFKVALAYVSWRMAKQLSLDRAQTFVHFKALVNWSDGRKRVLQYGCLDFGAFLCLVQPEHILQIIEQQSTKGSI